MNKITTYLHSAEDSELNQLIQEEEEQLFMNPPEESINKILQYAATYRTEVVSPNEYLGYYLN